MSQNDIRKENLKFYQKISPAFKGKTHLIPPPKLSPQLREQRRLAYRNERKLYKRKSSLSGAAIISFFHQDSPYVIYAHNEWWNDSWDPMKYGQDFDFSRGFFEQFNKLQLAVPRPPLVNNKSENSDYCNFADENKNCYLLTSANRNEDCYYGFLLVNNKNSVESLWCTNCELTYECIDCQGCYNVRYAQDCQNCIDSSFLLNCRGLKNCFLCINLQSKEYHILNKPCSKEEYEGKMREISGSYEKYCEMLRQFNEMKKQYPVRRASNIVACENVHGDNIFNSKNIYHGFDVYDSRDCAYVHDGLKGIDSYDVEFFDGVELCYESTSLIGYGYRFTMFCRESVDLFYCDNCHACKNCFGCIGLRNKEYCIFNKQYSKEKYEELVPQIIGHMMEVGEWGEFFPIKFSLFAYNETLAQEYFPITKEIANEKEYKWIESDKKGYSPQHYTISDNIKDVPNSIVNEILACEKCGKNYKIIAQELTFYKRMGLPVPRTCPDCRHLERMNLRNPRKLWKRNCGKCENEIATTYSPERPETVYCEECYLDEI